MTIFRLKCCIKNRFQNGPILESISSMKFYGQAEKPKIAIIVVTHRDGTGQYSLALGEA